MPRYLPASALESPRFCGIRTFMRLPHIRTTEEVDVAFVGIPWDDAVTHRSGARFGPEAIRRQSIQLRPWNPALDVKVFDYISAVDYGDSPVIPGHIHETYAKIVETFQPLFAAGVIPLGMGGDHSITLGELRAAAAVHGPVALVHIDAHLDTIDSYWGIKYGHGTPFARAVEEGLLDVSGSIQVGIRGPNYGPEDYEHTRALGFELITMYEVDEIGIAETIRRIHQRVGNRKCFITFDVDSCDPAYAPGTGTTEVGGFTSREAFQLVRGLRGLNFVGADVVEVLPAYDPGEITALLAANVLYEFISLAALRKRDGTLSP